MTIELSEEQKIKLINSDDVFSIMQEILWRENKIDRHKEHFWMIGMAANNRILDIDLVSLGGTKNVTVEPMNVYRVAVIKGAVKVVMVHNHPSGELKPSEADKDLTDRLIQVGRILDIEVVDSLIITTQSYLSFSDTGLLAQLQQSAKWIPQFELIERIKAEEKKLREEALKAEREKAKAAIESERLKAQSEKDKALKTGKQEGKQEKAIEIAKNLLKEGLPLTKISNLTGFSCFRN